MPTVSDSQSGEVVTRTDLRGFAAFLRGYMGVMPLVTAAFAPVLTISKVIPIYTQQAKPLACMSGLLGFLAVAWVFYARHALAAALFSSSIRTNVPAAASGSRFNSLRSAILLFTPFLLIVGSVACFFQYNMQLESSIVLGQGRLIARQNMLPAPFDYQQIAKYAPPKLLPSRAAVLAQQDEPIDFSYWLAIEYLGIFLCAELAFVIMATREYLQGLLHLTDLEIIVGPSLKRVSPGVSI